MHIVWQTVLRGLAATILVVLTSNDAFGQAEGNITYRPLPSATLYIPMPGFALISDQRTWKLLWARFNNGVEEGEGFVPEPLPYIDFGRHTLLGLSLGEWSCGPGSSIQSVSTRGDTLRVQYGHRRTEEVICMGLGLLPVQLVLIPKPDKPLVVQLLPEEGSPMVPPASWLNNLGPRDLAGIPEDFHTSLLKAHARDPRTSMTGLIELANWVRVHRDYEVAQALIDNPRVQRSVPALTALSESEGERNRALVLLMEKYGIRAARDRRTSKATLRILIEQIGGGPRDRGLIIALSRNPAVHADSVLLASFIPKATLFMEPCLRALAVLRRRWLPDTTKVESRQIAGDCPPDPKRKLRSTRHVVL